MIISHDLEADLYAHIICIAEKPLPLNYKHISYYIIYIMRLFDLKRILTKEDNVIFVNCFILINSLIFHPKKDAYEDASDIAFNERSKMTDILLTAL